MKRFTCIILVLLLLAMSAWASHPERYNRLTPYGPSLHMNIAQMGMGGLTSVVYSNAHTPFYNPALLARQQFNLELSVASFGLSSNFPTLLSFIEDHQEDFQDFESLTVEQQEEFYKDSEEFDNQWFGLQALPYVGMAFRNFGFGVYSVTQTDIKLDQGVFVPAVAGRGYSDVVFGAGWGRGFNFMDKYMQAGVTVKYISRRSLEQTRFTAEDLQSTTDVVNTITGELEESVSSLGFDLGSAITLGKPIKPKSNVGTVDLAFVIQDLFVDLDGAVDPLFKLGAMYHVPIAGNALINRFDVGAELADFGNREGVDFFQRVNMGAELSLLHLFRLRGGFHQGYPTFGLGLNLSIVSVDYASFAREMGSYPGQREERIHRIQVSFGWQR